jgi:hypothetical protein
MANIKAMPVLRYKQTDIEGRPAPAPTRLQPEPPPSGIVTALQGLNGDLQAVVGIFDPSQLPQGNVSGKALQGQQMQVDMTNFHYYDNLTRSIRHTGRIILDLIPKIYDRERVMRIIGDDGKPEMVTINEQGQDEQGVSKVLNDVTVGEYDVVMETGPGYNSKRQEAVDSMMSLLGADPTLMQTAGDLIFRNMDFPGADVIADRLAAANPMAQIDDKSPIPPQVQMQLANAKQQMQQMQQVIQQLQLDIKHNSSVKQMQEEAETKRELMRQTTKAHDVEMRDTTAQTDTVINNQTKIEIEQMKAQLALVLARMNMNEFKAANAEVVERAI